MVSCVITKRQYKNTGLALLSNFEAAEKAMDLMADSSGNAMQEFEKATKLLGRICSNTYLRNYLIAGKILRALHYNNWEIKLWQFKNVKIGQSCSEVP